jgi:hypothetical protein
LTVLADIDAKRCPSCHSKLRRRRGQPIVLGETSRLDQQAALIVEKRNRQRGERPYEYSPPAAPPPVDAPEPDLVAIVVESPAPERVETIVFEPAPVEPEQFDAAAYDDEPVVDEPVAVADAIAAFTLPERAPVVAVPQPEPEPELAPTPRPEPVTAVEEEIVLDDEVESELFRDPAQRRDVNTLVDVLYRKARGDEVPAAVAPVAVAPAAAPEPVPLPRQPRPRRRLRLSSAASRRRRGYGDY